MFSYLLEEKIFQINLSLADIYSHYNLFPCEVEIE